MRLFVGTSGYSYKEWKGSFYPDKMRANEMLAFYAREFDTVEINNTFYRLPDEDVLAAWAAEVPESFLFAVKAPRRISHIKRLRGVQEDVQEFVRRATRLGPKLGPLLVQLPPFMKVDVALLSEFVMSLPAQTSCAFEFRHESWFVDPVYDALKARDCALCVAESDDLRVPLVPTASWGYLRLRSLDYDDARLAQWVSDVAAQPWRRAYVYFKHEDEGLGPKFGRRFKELARSSSALEPDPQ